MNHLQAFALTLDDVGLALTVVDNWENDREGMDGCHAGFYGTEHDGVHRNTLPALSEREIEDVFSIEDNLIAEIDARRDAFTQDDDDEYESWLNEEDEYDEFLVLGTDDGEAILVPVDFVSRNDDGDDLNGFDRIGNDDGVDLTMVHLNGSDSLPTRGISGRRIVVIELGWGAFEDRQLHPDRSWKRQTRQPYQFLRHKRHNPYFL